MAAGWLKSLQCKSRAYDDVIASTSCRNSYQNLKDVVINVEKSKPKPDAFYYSRVKRSQSVKPKPNGKPEEEQVKPGSSTVNRVRRTLSAPIGKGLDSGQVTGLVGMSPFFPSVKELTEGHQSRNVVEIIFSTRWGLDEFSGRVEMVFKIQSPSRVLTEFEEYRDLVKLRAGPSSGARCVADGNEMMRFCCLGPTMSVDSGASDMSSGAGVVCTYSGSGAAHESVGGGKGRRAMVVCRVIAGRALKRVGDVKTDKRFDLGEFDSVSGENGELLVFDSRAVLPCFLVVYQL